ncbi:uncharacterized protein PG986_012662 [Apiospora aurea]|uniref:Uncharacterized protein n=1 Tax=Apiospora aurea TaxID=335848 RepID=A0ABR1Q0M0_9PEZI
MQEHPARWRISSTPFGSARVAALRRDGGCDETGRLLKEAAPVAALQRAGAETVVLGTKTMYSKSQGIEAASNLPPLHVADPTAERIVRTGSRAVGLLGTGLPWSESSFYRGAPARPIRARGRGAGRSGAGL